LTPPDDKKKTPRKEKEQTVPDDSNPKTKQRSREKTVNPTFPLLEG